MRWRQLFDRFDVDLPFFVNFPFGYTVFNANWFAADGIPILPVDDAGNENPYPLMRVQARNKATGAVLASTIVERPRKLPISTIVPPAGQR